MDYPQFLHLLRLVTLVAVLTKNSYAVDVEDVQVHNLTDSFLKVIPTCRSNSSLSSLVIERNQITLSDEDRKSLASYSGLVELHLDDNYVTNIPSRYLSIVPHLKVLSLSRNKISSIQPESLYGLHDLTVLNLSHNLLTSLPAQLFSNLNNLQVVDLQDNPWNCSCQLLRRIEGIKAVMTGPNTKCASPEQQAGMNLSEAITKCNPKSTPSSTMPSQNPLRHTTGYTQQPQLPATLPKTMQTTNPNNYEQKHASGNTWIFAACVAALALTTSILIVCAIKGPAWYRLFHNYRHKRLQQEENQEGSTTSSIYSETGRYMNQLTFTFEHHRAEREEDVQYFEDPYIKPEV
nr:leucine-rich repeat-containing protein 19-like [Nerophis lumbriciformis]